MQQPWELIKIGPCPFCGSPKTKLTIKRRGNYTREGDNFQGLCNRCKARGPLIQDDPQRAADEWDKRASSAVVSDLRMLLIRIEKHHNAISMERILSGYGTTDAYNAEGYALWGWNGGEVAAALEKLAVDDKLPPEAGNW